MTARGFCGKGRVAMKGLLRMWPAVVISWRPYRRRKALPKPPIVIETTRTPTACGQYIDACEVRKCVKADDAIAQSPSSVVARLPRAKAAHTCVVNNFVWKNPARVAPNDIQSFYARRIATPGTFAGYVEAEALGNLLGIRVGIWDKYDHRFYRWLTTQGVDDPKAPLVHVVNLSNSHWVALIAPTTGDTRWTELDAGGQGDCLFRALHAAVSAHPRLSDSPSATELRQQCAAELANKPIYQERIVSLSEQAWSEYRAVANWRRLWRRFF